MHATEPPADPLREHASVDAPLPNHDVLVGVLAHELRTPITTIYAGSAVLAHDDELLPSMRRELAADVYAEAARLFRAVEDLLVLTRLEHGALSVSREPVSVIRAVDSAAQYEAERWPMLQTRLRLVGTPAPVAADAGALAHAIRNMVSNIGFRATGPTELEIVIEGVDERVACRLLDRTATLGEGDLPGLFDLPATDPRPGMTSPGIAMYVAGQLVRAMGGRFWASYIDERCVEIAFNLPRYEAA
ncbi:MAG TPA: histidine kinase dimerization/phospho-acceptor domain-containing protein [Candidatus Saccharimonadales bacterium]|nr:histidine kinase dimerization/phospho-acceptor domain-containing protein [Candidatus Saccharimonadales bacterium]